MEKHLDVDEGMLALSMNNLNSHADNGFLVDPFPLHFDVVREFYNRY